VGGTFAESLSQAQEGYGGSWVTTV
jgi:hypothetical protein